MKKFLLVGLMCLLPLSACGETLKNLPLLNGQSVANSVPGSVSLKTEQALTVTHVAFNGISNEILLAVKAGILKGSNASKVKIYYDKAGDAIGVADKLDKAGNENGVLSAISDANSAIASAKKLVGGN